MTDPHITPKIEKSAIYTMIGIALLFLSSILATVLAPNLIDPSWVEPSSHFQVQMYEVADAHLYAARALPGSPTLDYVHHLKQGYSLMAFQETEQLRILADPTLDRYVTRFGEKDLKLTTKVMLLRKPTGDSFDKAEKLRVEAQKLWEAKNPNWKDRGLIRMDYGVLELYDPKIDEAFAQARTEGTSEHYVDKNFTILDGPKQKYHNDTGVIYVLNPEEYRFRHVGIGSIQGYRYDPNGQSVKDIAQLTGPELGFISRKDLIAMGEHIFAIEGCWYCHTDQSRTLIQDCVLNGGAAYAAPPSSGNEYIFQKITFPGTRRIGPDLARVGVKRPSRDWHKGHFWQPRTPSPGSIMPSFRHFFDDDPRGQSSSQIGIPNYRFEAMYQYLMTKGTRITAPTQAWWLGKDPLHTTEIIEGLRTVEP